MYYPERGDIVWTDFNPAAGHEQKGKDLPLFSHQFASIEPFGLALAAPITTRIRGHAFETRLDEPTIKVSGVILCQQIKMIDFKEGGIQFVAKAPAHVLDEALAKSRTLLN